MDFTNFIILQANETLNKNETSPKFVATKEEKLLAYFSILIMAAFPIIIGSFKSVRHLEKKLKSTEQHETMSTKDAAMFPVIASGALFSLYIVFKIFSKDYINLLITIYFFTLGVFALAHVIIPLFDKLIPSYLNHTYSLQFVRREKQNQEKIHYIDYDFTTSDVVSLVLSTLFGVWYLTKKHWIANNVLGIVFSINGIELLHLNTVINGITLLWGLFFYDIFWVFGTDVMITVAKSFEAPIKLIFPQDILRKGLLANNFAMLGLGDIVVPGIFIALLLRFDIKQKSTSYLYYYTCLFSYVLGLITTIIILTIFDHAQPALLYLVPCCVLIPLGLALIRGEIKQIFAYKDQPIDSSNENKSNQTESKENKEIKQD